MTTFPLDQWFNLSKPISKADTDLTEAQMMLYAVKQDMDPQGEEARKAISDMRRAVKEHNKKFVKHMACRREDHDVVGTQDCA
jgi:hypothetical protein